MPVLPGQASANAEERREDEMQRGPTTKLSDAGPEESAGLRGPDSIMACLDHLGTPNPASHPLAGAGCLPGLDDPPPPCQRGFIMVHPVPIFGLIQRCPAASTQ